MEKEIKKPTEKPAKEPASKDVKTSQHALRYFFVGLSVTLFNYIAYSLINLIFFGVTPFDMSGNGGNTDFLWLSSFIATTITTVVAYIAHSKITWKERSVTKYSIARFFIWNALLTFAIIPVLTQIFSFITPLYEFVFNIFQAIHLPFSYDFTLTTGAFVLTTIVVMILNFLFYDKFVFGKSKKQKEEEK